MERAATADFQRDVHVLIEQMYDAIERRTLDRDALRDLTDNLSDVIMPLTAVAAIPVLKPAFDKPELNAIGLSVAESYIVNLLDTHFGKIVTKSALIARVVDRLPERPRGGHTNAKKVVEVHICNIRAKLKSTPYGIRTEWGVGYALDHAEKCLVVGAGNRNAARKASPPE